jgi:hypothetical protein
MTEQDEFIGTYTDWSPYDVPRLASFLDEDLTSAWVQVASWQQTHELVARHREVLSQTRSALARAWPPERSPAAAKFIEVLDRLMASMDEMQDIAITNGTTLQGILNSLDEVKGTVDGLHEQWKEMEAVEGKKGFQDANWRIDLNQQARAQMSATDQAAVEYYSYLTEPDPYQSPAPPNYNLDPTPPPDKFNVSTSVGGVVVAGVRPPTIPPVPPLPSPEQVDAGPLLTSNPVGGSPVGPGAPGGQGQPPGTTPQPVSTGSWSVATPVGRAMRVGGVIGPVPPEPGSPGASAVSGRSGLIQGPSEGETQRGNPVGGLLGGPMGAGVHGDRRSSRRREPPYTEWEVPKGVPPVLMPPPEPTEHDPGPGVIGIDR